MVFISISFPSQEFAIWGSLFQRLFLFKVFFAWFSRTAKEAGMVYKSFDTNSSAEKLGKQDRLMRRWKI